MTETNDLTVTSSAIDDIKEQAAHWLVLLAEQPDTKDLAAFETWLAESPLHQQYYDTLAGTLGLVDQACHAQQQTVGSEDRAAVSQSSWAQRWLRFWDEVLVTPAAMATVSLLLVLGLIGVAVMPSEQVTEVEYATTTAELETFTLADGSRITLGPKSLVGTRFSDRVREVELIRGEAFFDVVSNKDVPFTVSSDALTVTVLGTQFDVRQRDSSQAVNVVEGLVRLSSTEQGQDHELLLQAGESAQLTAQAQLSKVVTLPTNAFAAWRQGRLVYVDQRLDDILSDANRYSQKQFVVVDPALAQERVTLSLNSAQIDSLPQLLGHLLPVKFSEFGDKQVLIDAL